MTIGTDAVEDFMCEHIGSYFDDIVEVYEYIDWPNSPFKNPELVVLDGPERMWAAVRFNYGERFTSELGKNPTFRTLGVITIMLFCPLNIGTGYIKKVAEDTRKNYEGSRLNSATIKVRNPRIISLGERQGWWQINVELPIEFDSQ